MTCYDLLWFWVLAISSAISPHRAQVLIIQGTVSTLCDAQRRNRTWHLKTSACCYWSCSGKSQLSSETFSNFDSQHSQWHIEIWAESEAAYRGTVAHLWMAICLSLRGLQWLHHVGFKGHGSSRPITLWLGFPNLLCQSGERARWGDSESIRRRRYGTSKENTVEETIIGETKAITRCNVIIRTSTRHAGRADFKKESGLCGKTTCVVKYLFGCYMVLLHVTPALRCCWSGCIPGDNLRLCGIHKRGWLAWRLCFGSLKNATSLKAKSRSSGNQGNSKKMQKESVWAFDVCLELHSLA